MRRLTIMKPNFLKILIPCVVGTLVLAGVGTVVGISIHNHLENQRLTPISSDLESFYKSKNLAECDPAEPLTIEKVYDAYKKPNEDPYSMLPNSYTEIVANGEDQYHCYYVDKNIYGRLSPYLQLSSTWLYKSYGLAAYIYHYSHNRNDQFFNGNNIMELTVSLETKTFEKRIGDYYFLDAIRLYHCVNHEDVTLIDFAGIKSEDSSTLTAEDSSENVLKYLHSPLYGGTPFFEYASSHKFHFAQDVDYFSLKVQQESETEVLKEKFRYNFENNDDAYYGNLKTCIISETKIRDYFFDDVLKFSHCDLIVDYSQFISLIKEVYSVRV